MYLHLLDIYIHICCVYSIILFWLKHNIYVHTHTYIETHIEIYNMYVHTHTYIEKEPGGHA